MRRYDIPHLIQIGNIISKNQKQIQCGEEIFTKRPSERGFFLHYVEAAKVFCAQILKNVSRTCVCVLTRVYLAIEAILVKAEWYVLGKYYAQSAPLRQYPSPNIIPIYSYTYISKVKEVSTNSTFRELSLRQIPGRFHRSH